MGHMPDPRVLLELVRDAPTAAPLGDPVCEMIAAAYNGRGWAVSDAWRQVKDWAFWSSASKRTEFKSGHGETAEWVMGWLPTHGVSTCAIDESGKTPSSDVASNPTDGPHICLRSRRSDVNASDWEGGAERGNARRGYILCPPSRAIHRPRRYPARAFLTDAI